MSRDKVLERIEKLLRVARGQANEHESAAAARAAERLMREHQIAESDVILAELARGQSLGTAEAGLWRRCPPWQGVLAVAVAHLFECEVRLCDHPDRAGRETLRFYGYRADTVAATWAFEYLTDEIDRLSRAFWDAHRSPHRRGAEARREYRMGAATAVLESLRQVVADREAAAAAAESGARAPSEGALITRAKAAAIHELFGEFRYHEARFPSSVADAYAHGRRDGGRLRVHRPLAARARARLPAADEDA